MTKSDGVPVDEDIQSELQQKIKLEGIRLNTSILACSFQELLSGKNRGRHHYSQMQKVLIGILYVNEMVTTCIPSLLLKKGI